MAERPILFSGPMVRAILEGRKTQTRRIVKSGPVLDLLNEVGSWDGPGDADEWILSPCPYGVVGDTLWVRETWASAAANGVCNEVDDYVIYKTTEPEWGEELEGFVWRPSIHMPRWASRLTLRITGVRVEPLQDISEADARAEGAMYHDGGEIHHSGWRHDYHNVFATAKDSFCYQWSLINGDRAPWASNPWVWVVAFERVEVSHA